MPWHCVNCIQHCVRRSEPSGISLLSWHPGCTCRYVHHNISMRFLTCEPNLSGQPDYIDEADIFYSDPIKWLRSEYPGETRDKPSGATSHDSIRTLPTHLVMFNALEVTLGEYLLARNYSKCATFFHTHAPEGRVGSHVVVFCRKMDEKPSRAKAKIHTQEW